MRILKNLLVITIAFIMVIPAFSEDKKADEGFNFGLDMELGAETFNDGEGPVAYQKLSLNPDISFGKVGIGMAVTLHYRFTDAGLVVRSQDWIPHYNGNNKTFLDIYLPLFRYIRYGHKGNPLYAKIGAIDDGTLGNGFLMGGYANTNFLPERRIVGLALDLDGSLFNFPYLGIETFTGNLAKFDVFGTRLYARPLLSLKLPVFKNLQTGTTFVMDRNPNALGTFANSDATPDPVYMYGVDFKQPVLNSDIFSLAVYGDVDFQPASGSKTKTSSGALLGFGGKLIGFMNYGLNALFLGDNYVPFYFDSVYDLYRQDKYEIYTGNVTVPGYAGWLASLGFSFLDDKLSFNTSLDGAFKSDPSEDSTFPHLKATFTIGEGIIPGIFFDASYDKRYIKAFSDLISPENAVIGADINYKTGPAVITLGYDLRYIANPEPGKPNWQTTAKLSTSISLF